MPSSTLLAYYSFNVETANILIGITLNAVLIFLIRRFSSTYLGNYKYLLAVFALFDIWLCSLHGLLNPVAFLVKNTFACALYVPWQSHELTSVYLGFFTVPFSLMNIHFLYRYWSVARPTRVVLFAQSRFVLAISLYPCAQGITWFFLSYVLQTDGDDVSLIAVKAVLRQSHDQPIDDGWMAMDHWRDGKLSVNLVYMIITTLVLIFASFSVAATLAIWTYKEILKTTTLSVKFKSVQYTLLVAVCAQTFVPLVCVYIPYLMCIISPFLSFNGFGMVDHFSLLLSIFPAWDAVVIILLIRDYRVGLMKALGCWKKTENQVQVPNTQFTTSFHAQPSTHL